MWEALTALATLGTGIAIAITVLLGARQLFLTGNQLDQLRRATRLEGTMKIFDDLSTPPFLEAMRFIRHELAQRMNDSIFLSEVRFIGAADPETHKELTVLRMFERIGTYVKHGLLDGSMIYDCMLPPILTSWERLRDVVRIHREEGGFGMGKTSSSYIRPDYAGRPRQKARVIYFATTAFFSRRRRIVRPVQRCRSVANSGAIRTFFSYRARS